MNQPYASGSQEKTVLKSRMRTPVLRLGARHHSCEVGPQPCFHGELRTGSQNASYRNWRLSRTGIIPVNVKIRLRTWVLGIASLICFAEIAYVPKDRDPDPWVPSPRHRHSIWPGYSWSRCMTAMLVGRC